jgi:hypothetical protein
MNYLENFLIQRYLTDHPVILVNMRNENADNGDFIPNTAMEYFNWSLTHSNNGDHDCAVADLTEAIRLDPFEAEAYKNRHFARDRANLYKDRGYASQGL